MERLQFALSEIQSALDQSKHEVTEARRREADLLARLEKEQDQARQREQALLEANGRLLQRIDELSATIVHLQTQVHDLTRTQNHALVSLASSRAAETGGAPGGFVPSSGPATLPPVTALSSPPPKSRSEVPASPTSSTLFATIDQSMETMRETAARDLAEATQRLRQTIGGGGASSALAAGASPKGVMGSPRPTGYAASSPRPTPPSAPAPLPVASPSSSASSAILARPEVRAAPYDDEIEGAMTRDSDEDDTINATRPTGHTRSPPSSSSGSEVRAPPPLPPAPAPLTLPPAPIHPPAPRSPAQPSIIIIPSKSRQGGGGTTTAPPAAASSSSSSRHRPTSTASAIKAAVTSSGMTPVRGGGGSNNPSAAQGKGRPGGTGGKTVTIAVPPTRGAASGSVPPPPPAPAPAPAPPAPKPGAPKLAAPQFFGLLRSNLDASSLERLMAALAVFNTGQITRSDLMSEAGGLLGGKVGSITLPGEAPQSIDLLAAFDAFMKR